MYISKLILTNLDFKTLHLLIKDIINFQAKYSHAIAY